MAGFGGLKQLERLEEALAATEEPTATSSFSGNTLFAAIASATFCSVQPLSPLTDILPTLLHAPSEAALGAYLAAILLDQTALKNEFGGLSSDERNLMSLWAFGSVLLVGFAISDEDFSPLLIPLAAAAGVMIAGGRKKKIL